MDKNLNIIVWGSLYMLLIVVRVTPEAERASQSTLTQLRGEGSGDGHVWSSLSKRTGGTFCLKGYRFRATCFCAQSRLT